MATEQVPATVKDAPSRAYMTFLAGDGDYVKGVVGLAKALTKVKTAYPLVVAVLPDVPQDHRWILHSLGCPTGTSMRWDGLLLPTVGLP